MTEQAAEEGPVKNMSNPHKSKGLPFIYTFVLLLWNGRSPSECQANINSYEIIFHCFSSTEYEIMNRP